MGQFVTRVHVTITDEFGTVHSLPAAVTARDIPDTRDRIISVIELLCDRAWRNIVAREGADKARGAPQPHYRVWLTLDRPVPGCSVAWLRQVVQLAMLTSGLEADSDLTMADVCSTSLLWTKFKITLREHNAADIMRRRGLVD